jgi:hypothetical protein
MKLIILIWAALAIGCATTATKSTGQAYTLEMKGRKGETEFMRYYSAANIKNYESGQITKDKVEIVDFTVRSKTVDVDPGSKHFVVRSTTVRKDGTSSLHELAFPELNEEIEFVIGKDARILSAGDYPPDSLFFVPYLPMPKDEVRVGDTWTLQHSWNSTPSGIPLSLDLVAIFKGVQPCFKTQTCADLEISGKVFVDAPTQNNVRFDGNVWGRLLFNIDTGDVVWSETRSSEDMLMGGDKIKVLSCLRSQLYSENVKPKKGDGFQCQPSAEPVPAPQVKL